MKLTCYGGSHDGQEIEIPEEDLHRGNLIRLVAHRPSSAIFELRTSGEIPTIESELYELVTDGKTGRTFLHLKK